MIPVVINKTEVKLTPRREVKYSKNELTYICADQTYKGVRYVIINRGIHPCAYVETTKEFLDKHQEEYDLIHGINVHGGVTFGGKLSITKGCKDIEGIWFGWDYGHCGDWAGYSDDVYNDGNHKWTTDEIIAECENAIDQYLEILKEDQKEEENKIKENSITINGVKHIVVPNDEGVSCCKCSLKEKCDALKATWCISNNMFETNTPSHFEIG